jgi:DNA-binding XRE family transcriptional regulator
MTNEKRRRLEAAGFKVGTVRELLRLTEAEAAFIEDKLALARALREGRARHGLTQVELAKRLGTSQSRIAKMENADPSVSADLLLRGLHVLGVRAIRVPATVSRKQLRRRRTTARVRAAS